MDGVVLRNGALDEAWVEGCCGVLEAVGYDFVDVGGSGAQEQLLFDWQGVLDGVAEAFGHSLCPEDGLRREVNEHVLHQPAGLENCLHRGGCGCFLCDRHVFGCRLILLALDIGCTVSQLGKLEILYLGVVAAFVFHTFFPGGHHGV